VIEEIRITLWHEVGHYLGISEANLHRLGYG
jgi:predicted Zn-dependent protease with MMP-like domain